jgi:hypothetical protein
MKLYNCKIRLHANANDEVRKRNVTAAEIRLLRKMHGEDAVIEIQVNGEADRTDAQERNRLSMTYGEKAVIALFGLPVVKIEEEVIADPLEELEAKPLPVGERISPEALAAAAEKSPSTNLFE